MFEEAPEDNADKPSYLQENSTIIKTQSRKAQPMLSLPFFIPFTSFADLNFINVLSSVLLYLEGITNVPEVYECQKKITGVCNGCGNCKTSLHEMKEQAYFYLDTMCGRSSLRCHFDATLTEMQQWLDERNGCGNQETVDFLFGFVGYDYRISADAATFPYEIRTSLENNRPVIARVSGEHGRFRVIIGMDGDTLLEPNYTPSQNLPICGVAYDEIQEVYLIGDQIPRKYTERDGLERIRKIMKYNESAGLWDEYQEKMGWWFGGMENIPPQERKVRMNRTSDTMWHTFNCHNFAEVFRHRSSDALKDPAYDEIQNIINPSYGYTHDLAWSLIGWNDIIDWTEPHIGIIIGYAEAIQLILWRIQQNDREVLAAVQRTLAQL